MASPTPTKQLDSTAEEKIPKARAMQSDTISALLLLRFSHITTSEPAKPSHRGIFQVNLT